MKVSYISLPLFTAALTIGAYIPSEPWNTLTPSDAAPSGAIKSYAQTFGIAILPIATKSDGSFVTPTPKAAAAVSQITDGQIQGGTSTFQAVSQITDGQIQASTATVPIVVSQIGDGQIQAPTFTPAVCEKETVTVTVTEKPSVATDVVTQIGDGQIQAPAKPTETVASQIGDGQIQAPKVKRDSASVACKSESALALILNEGELKDAHGRIGAIVANRQFQFDGPPPQAGTIYAGGWSIAGESLALGNSTLFFQCLSGNFYNLYDQSIGEHCVPVTLQVVDLVEC